MGGSTADSGDDARTEAMATVLAAAESGDGTVQWADVESRIGAEQWGGLVADGVLVPADDRFVIDDPDAVRVRVSSAEAPDDSGGEDGLPGWSRSDKLVGIGALAMTSGYQVAPVRNAVGGTLDVLLGPLHAVLPFPAVVAVAAVVVGVVSTVVQTRVGVDVSERMERIRTNLSELEDRIDTARERDRDEAVSELRSQRTRLVRRQFRVMGAALRPLAWTMVATIPVLLWLYWLVLSPNQAVAPVASVVPVLGKVVWTARIVGGIQVWLVWYFLCTTVSRLLASRARRIRDRVPTPA